MPDNGSNHNQPKWLEPFLHVRQNYGRFSAQPIPSECLDRILEIARISPTEWYFQPWRWIVVRSEAGKRQIEASTHVEAPLVSAPVVLICLADTNAWKTAPQQLQEMVIKKRISGERAQEILRKIREHYTASPGMAQRTALAHAFVALHQILMAAAECDLSAYWLSVFDEQKIKTHFHIPEQFLVAALLAIGYGEKPLPLAPNFPLQSLVYQEKFGEAFSE
ncbi:MAG: nitroreductase family protein [Terriglobia bacterium]